MKNFARSVIFLFSIISGGCMSGSSPQIEGGIATDSEEGVGPYESEGLNRPQLQSAAVLSAMSRVPRHRFVPKALEPRAYEDRALPIGSGQTISQPFIVALMTQEAGVTEGSKVLEIGTGSGYQAAVLAELGAKVFSIEIVKELALEAEARLKELGISRVKIRHGDGWRGWPEEAPFDSILVTAAVPKMPVELLSQLANRGKMVIPVQSVSSEEELVVVERIDDDFVTKNLGAVRFVPLTGEGRESN